MAFCILQIRHILENGSLYFPKFDATAFRQDVHWSVYKCIASNAGGTIISRDLSVKAGKSKIQFIIGMKFGFFSSVFGFDIIRGIFNFLLFSFIFMLSFRLIASHVKLW